MTVSARAAVEIAEHIIHLLVGLNLHRYTSLSHAHSMHTTCILLFVHMHLDPHAHYMYSSSCWSQLA